MQNYNNMKITNAVFSEKLSLLSQMFNTRKIQMFCTDSTIIKQALFI